MSVKIKIELIANITDNITQKKVSSHCGNVMVQED